MVEIFMVFSHLASAAALLFSLLVWVFPTQADTSGPQCAQSFATFKDLKTLDKWDHWIYWQRRLSRYELDSNQKEELVHLQVNLARGHNKSANSEGYKEESLHEALLFQGYELNQFEHAEREVIWPTGNGVIQPFLEWFQMSEWAEVWTRLEDSKYQELKTQLAQGPLTKRAYASYTASGKPIDGFVEIEFHLAPQGLSDEVVGFRLYWIDPYYQRRVMVQHGLRLKPMSEGQQRPHQMSIHHTTLPGPWRSLFSI